MKVHVLTTSRNVQRQEQIRKYWADWDIEFHMGYDYRDLKYPLGYHKEFALTCCWAGHHAIWNKLQGRDGWHLVVEDDAIPTPTTKDALEFIEKSDSDRQIIKLYHLHEFEKPDRHLFDINPGPRPLLNSISSSAYVIRNTGSALTNLSFVGSPDISFHLSRIKVGGIWPLAADILGESIIPYDTSPAEPGSCHTQQ